VKAVFKLKTFLDADPRKNKTTNNIIDEIHSNIVVNDSITLNHDIYFGESLSVIETEGDVLLNLNIHYMFDEKDTIASRLSGKNCFRKVKFLFDYPEVKISYHAYGDFLKSANLNNIVKEIKSVKTVINDEENGLITKLGTIEKTLNTEETGVLARIDDLETTVDGSQDVEGLVDRVISLESEDENFGKKIQAMHGYGGFLEPHDFGSDSPSQDELTAYALTQIDITSPLEIFNGTHVKNIWVNPNLEENPDGTPIGDVWVLTNTQNTTPKVFEWINDGPDRIGAASNERYGVIKGVAEPEDPEDRTKDGFVTIENNEPKTIGYSGLKNKVSDLESGKLDKQQSKDDAGKALVIGGSGKLEPGFSGVVDGVDGVGPADPETSKNVKLTYSYETETEFEEDKANIPEGARVVKLYEFPENIDASSLPYYPNLWPDGTEVNLGGGLYGITFSGTFTNWGTSGTLNFYAGYTINGWVTATSRTVSAGGSYQKGADPSWHPLGYHKWADVVSCNAYTAINSAGDIWVNASFENCPYSANNAGYWVWIIYKK
jgi:hypothetical protein